MVLYLVYKSITGTNPNYMSELVVVQEPGMLVPLSLLCFKGLVFLLSLSYVTVPSDMLFHKLETLCLFIFVLLMPHLDFL